MNDLPPSEAPPAHMLVRPQATGAQLNYLRRLLAQRHLLTDEIAARLENLTRDRAHDWIVRALEIPLPEKPIADPWPGVPAGRYAIWNKRDGCMRFYHVQKPNEGRWNGYVFVKVQAGDEVWPVKGEPQRNAILAKIAQDARSASIAYGRELGACGICGRTLTDPDSINAGIGPICAGKAGW